MFEQTNPRNLLIRQLSKPVADAIFESAQCVYLDLREKLIKPDQPIEFVDFPENGVMSLLTPLEDNSFVEIASVGLEGMVGVPIVQGVSSTGVLAVCNVEGAAWRIRADRFQRLLTEYPELASVCHRYTMTLFEQIARNVGCNRNHAIEKRCARWLLMTHDRCGTNTFPLTQEFLARMLGVSRTGVNHAGGVLARAGLISYVRGKVTILDRDRLEEFCCGCYLSTQKYYDQVLQRVPKATAYEQSPFENAQS